jgi:hypothetical protein
MMTLKKQLKMIRDESLQIKDVVSNYEMGLITISEMNNQIQGVLLNVDKIKDEICMEYNVNHNAVNLMLEL